jgi:DNA gyrase subunit A
MEPTGRNPFPVAIEDEMRVSYLDYAMSVIIGRALPDVRDGLKPVHRRALYAMYELKNNWNGPYKKSARIVGDCIGKYHPHGDQSVYDAVVRMAQDFSMRVPLVDGQGNFGSVDGDAPAAMRYTEVRMAKIAHQLLADLEKETVEFGPNYDDSLKEPLVFPTKFPNLLVNGSSGIAVGMATNIPPHNLRETIDAVIAVIRNPAISLGQLMQIVPGPDFPTGGVIFGTRGIREAYETGRGIVRVRAVTEVEEMARDRERIVVTELPYQVNKARLLEKIAELVRDKRLEGISDLRDESDRQGMRMVIELKRDVQPQVVLNQLFKLTALQSSFGINMVAIVHGEPRVLGLREVLEHFIDHRRDVTLRRTRYDLRQAEARAHILEGLKIALDFIDLVISIIRNSPTVDEAREGLMTQLNLSEIQAKAILEMRLRRLTGLEREEIIRELEELRLKIAEFKAILASDELLMGVIEGELIQVRDEFADERRTRITADDADLNLEDLIAMEDMVVTVSHTGYIKRVPLSEYRTQKRGGRGKSGMATKEEDFVEHLFVANTHAHMLFFTSAGRVFTERVFHLPTGSRSAKGKPIWTVFPFEEGEKLAMVLAVDEFTEGQFLLFATAQGQVKKTDLMAYSNIRSSGIIAINLEEGDKLIAVRLTTGHSDILLATAQGMAIRFPEEGRQKANGDWENAVRPMGRDTTGVKGIELEEGDEVVGCITLERNNPADENAWLLTATARGFGKRTPLQDYLRQKTNEDGTITAEAQSRGGKGMIDIKTTERNGPVVGVVKIESDRDDYLLVTNGGILIRARAGDVSIYKRNTQGVKLINVGEGEQVVSLARYAESDADDPDASELSDLSVVDAVEGEAADSTEGSDPAEGESTDE